MTRDQGLAAVARVRSVREQESRRRLQHALARQRDHQRTLGELQQQIAAAAATEAGLFGTDGLGDPRRLLALRTSLTNLSGVLGEAHRSAAAAERASDLARSGWEDDKTRLTAVEKLLERRLAEHRADLARAQARESDELASASWVRRTAQAAQAAQGDA